MHDNPSAGKFDPPSGQERFEAPKSRPVRQWSAVALAVLLFLARYELHHVRTGGWLSGLAALGAFAIGVGDFIAGRRARDRRDGADPYTPPQRVTR